MKDANAETKRQLDVTSQTGVNVFVHFRFRRNQKDWASVRTLNTQAMDGTRALTQRDWLRELCFKQN